MDIINFKYWYKEGVHYFNISGDYIKDTVIRSEGGVNMVLKNPTLTILSEEYNIHGDHKALIFILAFYPVILKKCNIKFNFPVSNNFIKNIKKIKDLKKINITSKIQNSLYTNSGEGLLFGGGIDTTSISILLPDITKINQININNKSKQNYETISGGKNNMVYVKSNIRDLYTVWGLPVWVSIFIVGIIKNKKYLISGSKLNDSYLKKDTGYREHFNNPWYVLFRNLNINVLPFAFLSDPLNSKIVVDSNMGDFVVFCYRSKKQNCCKCTKCFRKYLYMSVFDSKYLKRVDGFDLLSPKFVSLFTPEKTLKYGASFKYCINSLLPKFPDNKNLNIIKKYISKYEISDVSFFDKYYSDDFNNTKYPNRIYKKIIEELHKRDIKPMTKEDVYNLKNLKNEKY